VFPFYTWIPLLAEEVHPYILGFLLWILPTATLFFGLGFIDRYTWLRDTPVLGTILTVAGALMVTTGGLLAVFQQKLSRIMGYAVIVETGFSLLALSLVSRMGVTIFLLLLVPRMLSLAVWALGLSVLKEHAPGLSLAEIKGFARFWPFAVTGIILANFSLAGVPLLAGFPSHQVVWEELARTSLSLSLWVFLGSLCLGASAIRVLTSVSRAPDGTGWAAGETVFQRTLMITGWLVFLMLGLFPQWVLSLWSRLPPIFEHLGQ
jgi:multicomponent Na+:H+ antiporter subunit D